MGTGQCEIRAAILLEQMAVSHSLDPNTFPGFLVACPSVLRLTVQAISREPSRLPLNHVAEASKTSSARDSYVSGCLARPEHTPVACETEAEYHNGLQSLPKTSYEGNQEISTSSAFSGGGASSQAVSLSVDLGPAVSQSKQPLPWTTLTNCGFQ